MTRVIKAELYKLSHNKAYIGIMIISIAFLIGMNIAIPETGSFKSAIVTIADMIPMVSILIIIGLTQSDYNEGTMKNVITSGVSRTSVYFGKLIAAFIATMILFFFEAIITVGFAVYHDQKITIDILFFIKTFLLQSFVMLNYTVIYYLIGNIIKSPAFAVTISFAVYMFGAALFGLAGNYLHISNLANYELGVISRNVEKINVSTVAIEHLVAITAIIIIFSIIGNAIFKKQDIK